MLRLFATLALAIAMSLTAAHAGEKRTLSFYYTHTKESLSVTFKDGGRFVPAALAELNHFLRDWRRNEPTEMDPRLFDLIWAVYQDVGATKPIHIVSAYRSPATNEMLRAKSSGVAEGSQHTHGRAMDFFIPGVALARLRASAMKLQGGGVGYYPTSGSPFVHLDVGSVRAWPRMTKAQLIALFPDGKTVHLPSDGKPLAGYDLAKAELARKPKKPDVQVAESQKGGSNLFDVIFGKKGSPDGVTVAGPAKEPMQVATGDFKAIPDRKAPIPLLRPDFGAEPIQVASIDAPVPATKPAWMTSTRKPTVEMIEGDYSLLGYAGVDKPLAETDPFAFLNDLPPSSANLTPHPTLTVFSSGGVLSDADPLYLNANLLEDVAFSSFQLPEQQSIRYLIQASQDAAWLAFEPEKAPRRF